MGMVEQISEDDRATSLGIIRYSIEYFAAAVATQEKLELGAPGGVAVAPVYTLAGHSIELALKAFVRQHGADLKDLKNLGHDLDAAMDAAEATGLQHAADRTQLSLLNQEYSQHRFRYIRTGYVQLLDVDSLFSLTAAVFEPCITNIPMAWRFMWRTPGKIVAGAGWLSATKIKLSSPAE
jgi:hypothetical protein